MEILTKLFWKFIKDFKKLTSTNNTVYYLYYMGTKLNVYSIP